MPGLAKSADFFLSSATVMIGAMDELKTLNPADHSVGLVKNFQLASDPKTVDLTQGILNDLVATLKVDLGLKASWEMYEYTSKNLTYAMGLDGTQAEFDTENSTVLVTADADVDDLALTVAGDVHTSWTVGKWAYVFQGTEDKVHIFKIASSAFSTPDTDITIATGYGLPFAITAGAKVCLLHKMDLGLDNSINDFSMKIVGVLPKLLKPITLLFPKVQITRGLNFTFGTDNWGNMPFEAAVKRPLPSDVGFDEDFSVPVTILRQ